MFDCPIHRVDIPVKDDLPSIPSTISYQQFLDRCGLLAVRIVALVQPPNHGVEEHLLDSLLFILVILNQTQKSGCCSFCLENVVGIGAQLNLFVGTFDNDNNLKNLLTTAVLMGGLGQTISLGIGWTTSLDLGQTMFGWILTKD